MTHSDSGDSGILGRPVPGWVPPPHPAPVTLEGRFVRLEPLTPAHAAGLHAANTGDPLQWTWLPYGPFDSAADLTRWIETVAGKPDPMFLALVDPAQGHALGVASWLRIAPVAGSIEVGHINYSPRMQRSPAATEAMALMMGHAFSLGYRRYEWKCDALNHRSRRAAQRLGFSYEGLFRQAAVVKGRNRDTAWFAVTDGDWNGGLKAAFDRWLAPENFDAGGRQRVSLSDLTRPLLVATDPGPTD